MQQEGRPTTEAQSPGPHTTHNTVSIQNSAFCVVYMGQIVINVPRLFPARTPLQQLGFRHWVWVVLVAGFGVFSAAWLGVFALAHATTGRWAVPIGLFGFSTMLMLWLLEWGVLSPLRAGRPADIQLGGTP